MDLIERLKGLEARYQELEGLLADPAVIQDKTAYQQYAKEFSVLSEPVAQFRRLNKVISEMSELQGLLKEKNHDRDFLEMTKEEITSLQQEQKSIEGQVIQLLSFDAADANRDVIIEIRGGTGGEEASLFAADLYRMYGKYALAKGWTVELMASSPTELGGFKEIVFAIKGKDAYRRLKFESGVHRVQRVPTTEASGRIHTSAATVAIMIEPEEVDLNIEPKDIRIDVFRSSGHGGQSVNTTDSAVRITHISTGLVVICQDERSQLKNKMKAMRVLRARLLSRKEEEEAKKMSQMRKSQVGSGDRSEKIRTYNFPDRRVTDHRIGLTLHKLDFILEGDLDEITDALLAEAAKNQ